MDQAQAQRNQEEYIRHTSDYVNMVFPATVKGMKDGKPADVENGDKDQAIELKWLGSRYRSLKQGAKISVPRSMAEHYIRTAAIHWTPRLTLLLEEIDPEKARASAAAKDNVARKEAEGRKAVADKLAQDAKLSLDDLNQKAALAKQEYEASLKAIEDAKKAVPAKG